ncbi:MAG: hypothetical protein ABI193_02960 [Minicystis sp.]
MEKLSRGASGLRHLRWGREILASLEAHYEHNGQLTQPQRELVLDEAIKLRGLVTLLSNAAKPYRDFLERRRVLFRGMQRVGRFLCEDARARAEKALLPLGAEGALSPDRTRRSQGHPEGAEDVVTRTREASEAVRTMGRAVASLGAHADELAEAAAILEGFNEASGHLETRERLPLMNALDGAIDALRLGLEGMNQRLVTSVGPSFVRSLYPALAREGTVVADEEDRNDDAAGKG